MATDRDTSKGDEYHHPDGTVEIVFATEADRVLTVREYGSTDGFLETVADATYRGINEDVAGLPPAEAFGEQASDATDGYDENPGSSDGGPD